MRIRTKPFWWVLVIVIVLNCLLKGCSAQNYVPLNSLTISNLYKKNSTSSTERPAEKLWWTDLQEKREEYKANRKKMREKLKQQQLKQPSNNGRLTTLASSLLSNSVTEVPRPFSQGSTVAIKEMAQSSVPFPSEFTDLFSKPIKATIQRVTKPLPARRTTTQRPGQTSTLSTMTTLKQGTTKQPTRRPSTTTTTSRSTLRPAALSTTQRSWPTSVFAQISTNSKLPETSLIGSQSRPPNIISTSSSVPGGPYTKVLFDKFVSKLTQRGLIRKIPVRQIKLVFFNLLAAIGKSTDEDANQDLLNKYLEHFRRSDVDNRRRFELGNSDFRKTSELIDRLMFAYLQDSYAGTNGLTYHTTTTRRPFTSTTRRSTRPVLTWKPTPRPPRPIRTTPKSPNFALPPLETTKMPQKQVSSTTTFGGVASNTMRPTTKSMLAEMEFPSNHDKPKYQFMHDPDKYKTTTSSVSTTSLPSVSDLVSIWNIIRTSTTTPAPPTPTKQLSTFGEKLNSGSTQVDFVQLSTKDTTVPMSPTTPRPNTPPFYPQLTQADPPQEVVQFPALRPNFTMDSIATTKPPRSTYRPAMDFDQFLQDHTFPLGTTTATLRPSTTLSLTQNLQQNSNSNLSAGQWSQLLSKLNFALDKLSMLEDNDKPTPSESKTGSFDILNNPQYLDNNRPSSSLNGVKINVLSVDENEYEEVNDPINYDDYFQAIADVDNLNLNNPHHDHPRPAIEDDYLYFNDDIIDKFFTFDIPSQEPPRAKPFDLPGVGSRNPVPLSDFPSDGKREEYPLDLGKYPVQIPIPLTEAERLGLSVIPNKLKTHRPTNIGTKRKEESVSIGGKIRLAAPGVISEVFGPPANMTDMRASIPDFTSSGPVNIPSPLQLYGNIEKYLNETKSTGAYLDIEPQASIYPSSNTPRPASKPFISPTYLAALFDMLGGNEQTAANHDHGTYHSQDEHHADAYSPYPRRPSTQLSTKSSNYGQSLHHSSLKKPLYLSNKRQSSSLPNIRGSHQQGSLKKPQYLSSLEAQKKVSNTVRKSYHSPAIHNHVIGNTHSSSHLHLDSHEDHLDENYHHSVHGYERPMYNRAPNGALQKPATLEESTGPVKIPSPLHLYGNINDYQTESPQESYYGVPYDTYSDVIKHPGPPIRSKLTGLPDNNFKLPVSDGALKQPQSLVNLVEAAKPIQPAQIKWLKDRNMYQQTDIIPTSYYPQNTYANNQYSSEIQSRNNLKFKSPPLIVPLDNGEPQQIYQTPSDHVSEAPMGIPVEQFTILTPQRIPGRSRRYERTDSSNPFHMMSKEGFGLTKESKDHIFKMVLRHQSIPNRRRRKRSNLILKPPAHYNQPLQIQEDTQLKPEDAIVAILQNRPATSTTTSTTTRTSTTTSSSASSTTTRPLLSKPSAISQEELSLAKPLTLLNANQINIQTSLLGVANPLTPSNGGTISYNKLLIAAALSVVPTLAIAFPFLGKRK